VYQKCSTMLESSFLPITIMYPQRPDMRSLAVASDGEVQVPFASLRGFDNQRACFPTASPKEHSWSTGTMRASSYYFLRLG
jgi:hypothetical protein